MLRRAAELGFRANPFARGLSGKTTKIVGVLVSRINHPLFAEILNLVADRVSKNNMSLMLVAGEHVHEMRDGIDMLMAYDPTAVLVFSSYASADEIANAPVAHEKIVYFNRPPKRPGSLGLVYDNVLAGERVAAHLIALGHTRLAYLSSGTESFTDQERGKGFASYCRAHGVAPPEVIRTTGFTYEDGAAAGAAVAGLLPAIDAIFCASDMLALGLLDAARHRFGIEIPRQLSIIGCGDIAMSAWPSHSLTTIRLPRQRMADELVRLIEGIADGKRPDAPLIPVPPSEIVVRQSTAPKRSVAD